MLKNYTGPVFIIIAALLWALDGLIRQHLYTLPPITIIFFEHLIGLAVLTPFIWKYVRQARPGKREWWLLVLIAVLSGLLGTLWFTTALAKVNFITLSVVFLLQKLQPVFAITTASIFLKERFERGYIPWAAMALLAAYFVTFPSGSVNFATGAGTAAAALYALGAAFAWGSSTTFSKMLLGKVSPQASTFYRFLFTLVLALPILIIFGYGPSLIALSFPQFAWLALIAVSTGMVALLIYYKGLEKTSVHVSTILELTFPFIAILLDKLINGVTLDPVQWLAAVLLVFSIYRIARLRESTKTVEIQ